MTQSTIFLVTGHRNGHPELLTLSGSHAEDYYWESMTDVCHPDNFDSTDGYVDEVPMDEVEFLLGRPLTDGELVELSERGYTYL